jgi:hypothetical protein
VITTDAKTAQASQASRGEDRRRSQRVLIRMPVTLEFAADGKRVTISAATESVNDHGAMLLCPRSVAAETQLQVRNGQTQQQRLCRVVRAPIESGDGYLVPVEFADPAPGFWGISFPPSNWRPVEE